MCTGVWILMVDNQIFMVEKAVNSEWFNGDVLSFKILHSRYLYCVIFTFPANPVLPSHSFIGLV